ncbi:hypothetical protein J6590_051102 [Homalodisca vitripennis]|nr:hypothetical protein J6590_051102 [Homalodisca vitripennis]
MPQVERQFTIQYGGTLHEKQVKSPIKTDLPGSTGDGTLGHSPGDIKEAIIGPRPPPRRSPLPVSAVQRLSLDRGQ